MSFSSRHTFFFFFNLDKKGEEGQPVCSIKMKKKIMPSLVILFLERKGSKRLKKSTLSADQT